MDAYTHWYLPRAGDIVWDAGAHAGASSYFLAQMVGPSGRVYDSSRTTIILSTCCGILMHHLANVVPVKKALSGKTGTVMFDMEGNMCSGIGDYLVYPDSRHLKAVPTLSIADACSEFGTFPAYVKMDIEGAELASIREPAEFLKSHPIHFAMETNHLVDNEYTYKSLDPFSPLWAMRSAPRRRVVRCSLGRGRLHLVPKTLIGSFVVFRACTVFVAASTSVAVGALPTRATHPAYPARGGPQENRTRSKASRT